MAASPIVPTPFTDLGWMIAPRFRVTGDSFCAKLTMKLADCVEAYGMHKAKDKCAELFYDACECDTTLFQRKRAQAIRKERMRKYRAGEIDRPFEEQPPLDSFVYMY